MPHVAQLNSRALVSVGGEDWRGFLHNLVTQDVETLAPGEIRFTGLLTPQGRVLFDIFLVGQAEGCLLDVAADRRSSLVQRLTMYRLRAKVQIATVDEPVFAAWGGSPAGEGWMQDPRLPQLGWRGYGVATAATAAEYDYHEHRMALGVPDTDGDCPPDKTYPIEANFDLMKGIDFHKGCFVGQETTSRMKRRGQVRNRMMPIAFDGPAPPFGAEVLAGELRAGEVLCGHDGGRAIALLRIDRLGGGEMTVEGRPVRAHIPDWWPEDVRAAVAVAK